MKIQKSKTIEDLVYILACICSFGMVWVSRIIITKAIKSALED